MTKDELLSVVDGVYVGDVSREQMSAAVDAYTAALIAAKPFVIGSLPDDSELEDWLFDGYERNEKNLERLKIGKVVRDRIAQKLNSGNDR